MGNHTVLPIVQPATVAKKASIGDGLAFAECDAGSQKQDIGWNDKQEPFGQRRQEEGNEPQRVEIHVRPPCGVLASPCRLRS